MVAHLAGVTTKAEAASPFLEGVPARGGRAANEGEEAFAAVLDGVLFPAGWHSGPPGDGGAKPAEARSEQGSGGGMKGTALRETPGDASAARTSVPSEGVSTSRDQVPSESERALQPRNGAERRAERRGRDGERNGGGALEGRRAEPADDGAAQASAARLGSLQAAKGARRGAFELPSGQRVRPGAAALLAEEKTRGGESRGENHPNRSIEASRYAGRPEGKAAAGHGKLDRATVFASAEWSRRAGGTGERRAVRDGDAPSSGARGPEPLEGRRGEQVSSKLKAGENERTSGRAQSRKASGEGFMARGGVGLETDPRSAGPVEREKPTVKSGAPGEASRAGGELLDAAAKYEASIARAASKTDHVIPRNTDEILSEIVKNFTLVARRGGGEAHITLQPDFLGRLKLDLKLRGKEVDTLIVVDNQAVKDLIVNRLTVLEQGLLEHGLSLGSFQVEVKDGGRDLREAYREGRGRTGERTEGEPEPLETGAPSYGLPWLSTVVNVTA